MQNDSPGVCSMRFGVASDPVDQGDNDLAVARLIPLLDNDVVTVEYPSSIIESPRTCSTKQGLLVRSRLGTWIVFALSIASIGLPAAM